MILYAATTGKLDDVPTPRVKEFETQFYRFLETEQPEILKELGETNALTDEVKGALDKAIERFRVEVFGLEAVKEAPQAEKKPDEGSISASPAPPTTEAAVETAAKNAEEDAAAEAKKEAAAAQGEGAERPAADAPAADKDATNT